MADRFRETGQVQSLLTLAQQAPAAAQEVRTRLATMMADRLISQGQEALPAIVQDLEAVVLFACYDGALQAAQNVPQPEPSSLTAEAVRPEPAPLVAEPLALPPSLTVDPNSRPVSRPAPRVAQEAALPPEAEVETTPEVAEAVRPEPVSPVAEPAASSSPEAEAAPIVPDAAQFDPEPTPELVPLGAEPLALAPSPTVDPSLRPVSRPAPQEAAPLPPEAETAPVVAEAAQSDLDLTPEPASPAAELAVRPPSLTVDPNSRPVSRPAPRVAQEAAPPPEAEAETVQPEPASPVAEPAVLPPSPETETTPEVAEAAGPDPDSTPELLPWGVILTAQTSREAAERQAAKITGLIREERIDYVEMRVPGQLGPRHVAQVGRATRGDAEEFCERLKAQGTACMVLRN